LAEGDGFEKSSPVLFVSGADLVDGTPIYDIKPYLAYADCHPNATCGFLDDAREKLLEVFLGICRKNFHTAKGRLCGRYWL